MQLEKVYRNHVTGQELRSVVEKPDNVLILGCAHLEKFNEHGDMLEECVSPNVVTTYMQDSIGRLVFNSLFLNWITPSQVISGTLSYMDTNGQPTVVGTSNALKMHSQFLSGGAFGGSTKELTWPFRSIVLTNYDVPESDSELYIGGIILGNKTRNQCNSTLSTLSADGRTLNLVYEWGLPDFSGTVYSVAWAYQGTFNGGANGNPAQGARTHIPGGITKTTSDALRVTYTFTYSGT